MIPRINLSVIEVKLYVAEQFSQDMLFILCLLMGLGLDVELPYRWYLKLVIDELLISLVVGLYQDKYDISKQKNTS